MDNANPRLEGRPEPVYYPVRGQDASALTKTPFTQNSGHPPSPAAKSLADVFKAGDFSSIEAEFERAISQVDRDPHAAITAASAIIEALCKTYIETHGLEMPSKLTIGPLWKVVQMHLGLNVDPMLQDDQKRILQGLASIVDGVGAYRTHIGSAHGRGIEPPKIVPSEARLAVHASHTIVIFVMERWLGHNVAC